MFTVTKAFIGKGVSIVGQGVHSIGQGILSISKLRYANTAKAVPSPSKNPGQTKPFAGQPGNCRESETGKPPVKKK
jgi:hypothetical protein